MKRYIKLIQANTPYATRMTRLRNRIFGDPVGNVPESSLRVVKMFREEPLYKRDYIVKYYPRFDETRGLMTKLREYGLYRDEYQDFIAEMSRQRKIREDRKNKDNVK